MNTLREALQEYLALRRGLGFKMYDAGLLLPRFVAFMEKHQALHITAKLVVISHERCVTCVACAPTPAAHAAAAATSTSATLRNAPSPPMF